MKLITRRRVISLCVSAMLAFGLAGCASRRRAFARRVRAAVGFCSASPPSSSATHRRISGMSEVSRVARATPGSS